MMKLLCYIRALFMAPWIVVWTGLCSTVVLILFALRLPTARVGRIIADIWADPMLWLSGVQLEIRGEENLPEGGFLYLFNHTSHYDIPVMFTGCPKFPHFGAKIELFSIPIFGRAIKAFGALPIERSNRQKVMQVYREAERRVRAGDVFALAPEGTRQGGFGQLGVFKSGPFFFAVNAQMPLVPVVIAGCEKVIPKHGLLVGKNQWKQKVIMEFLPPTYPDGRSEEQVPFLKEKIHSQMAQRLGEIWSQELAP